MSAAVDGTPPSMSPDPGDGEGSDRRRRAPAGTEDSGPLWLQEEMRRRMDANARSGRGRHARDEADTDQFGVSELRARFSRDAGTPDYTAYPDYEDDDADDGPFDDPEVERFERVLGPASVPLRVPPPEVYDDGRGDPRGDGPRPGPPPDPQGPPAGPGGMRQSGAPGSPLSRAGRPALAPDSLGARPPAARPPAGEYPAAFTGEFTPEPPSRALSAPPPAAPTAPPGTHPGLPRPMPGPPVPGPSIPDTDAERTDVGVVPPVPADDPGYPEPPFEQARAPLAAAAPTDATPAVDPASRLPLSARTAGAPSPAVAPTAPTGDTGPGRPVGARFRPVEEEQPEGVPRRVRVVLSERKGVARTVRTVVDVQEGTAVGELLRTNLIGSQLAVALRYGGLALLVLGVLPVLFAFYPELGRVDVLGLRLPWLLLGVLVYPFLLALGWRHTRAAERVEQNFADHVQD
ncbi:hypothetical protein LWC35_02650 [Pseudonocardia kujensis]|uniref:hypothetical protein n=1 Tax=Pseudonocardia kujensis TaxID=1128675 RepID=UPI001E438957|nr:hypothetical protein [Pseudonocardia kujensis]MCE0761819.1 hypothetical protein [Pseudonocardia kujensis]